MRKRRIPPKKPPGQRPEDIDPDVREIEESLAGVDLESLETERVQLDPALRERVRQKRLFREWYDKLVKKTDIMGGKAVFPGSRLTVRHVGGMLERGASSEEILEDYPYLTAQDLEFSRIYLQAQRDWAAYDWDNLPELTDAQLATFRRLNPEERARFKRSPKLNDVVGSANYSGPSKTLADMDEAVAAAAKKHKD